MLAWILIGWPVASFAGALFIARCMAFGMGTLDDEQPEARDAFSVEEELVQ